MPQKLMIILASTDPLSCEGLSAPLFQACVAAGMNYSVEVVFTGPAAKLLRSGVAEGICLKADEKRTIYDFIKEGHAAGVRFFCFSPGLDGCPLRKEELIPEFSGVIGAAHFVEEIMSSECRVLTY
ncbi:50S ribosomal protein L33 [Hyphomicrobium sp. 99]|uniref:50S ribosomal protein L33 n=1 Tax=Hyphomicrobium sp. 99 TaxID=1163419 RepID=UPI0005F78698|nr:50S ribosomal protein L33 [Hyphomicrobium sp. 99]